LHSNLLDENLLDQNIDGVDISTSMLNMSIDDDDAGGELFDNNAVWGGNLFDDDVGEGEVTDDEDRSVVVPHSFDAADLDSEDDDDESDDGVDEEQPVINAFPCFHYNDELFQKFEGSFGDPLSSLFFYQNHLTESDSCKIPGGIRGIVHRSLAQDLGSTDMSDPIEAGFYFDALLKMKGDASEDDKEATIRLIRGQLQLTLPLMRGDAELPKMPLCMEDARKCILSGQYSMLENIPVEGLVNVDNMHACSSIEKVIDVMMGMGIRPSFIQSEFGVRDSTGINGTVAANDICNELRDNAASLGINPNNVAIGWITVWSGKSRLKTESKLLIFFCADT
jgi:hypothetical protein